VERPRRHPRDRRADQLRRARPPARHQGRGPPPGRQPGRRRPAHRAGALERKGGGALEATGKPEKSLLAGAGLGLLGPLGWLYSGSFKETIPAALVVILVASVLPTFLLMPLMPLILPLSAMVGALYAWQYNKTGERQTLFFDKKKDDGA
jgi:hypothetical protein